MFKNANARLAKRAIRSLYYPFLNAIEAEFVST